MPVPSCPSLGCSTDFSWVGGRLHPSAGLVETSWGGEELRICPSSVTHSFQAPGRDLLARKWRGENVRWCQVGGCCRALWGHADSRVFLDSWHPFCSSSHPQGAALHPVVVTSMFWCSLGLQSGQKPHQKCSLVARGHPASSLSQLHLPEPFCLAGTTSRGLCRRAESLNCN